MIGGSARRTVLAALGLVLVALAGGFASGLLGHAGIVAKRTESDGAASAAPPALDPSAAVRALAAHGHWGRYTQSAAGTPAPVTATPAPAGPLDDVERAWRLVGVEHRDGETRALLLPTGADPDSTDLLRLRSGESLAEGVRVSAIGRDSVRFDTPGGNSTLYLYGSPP